MRVITENTFSPLSGSSVVTIGNFDGIHLGHRALIECCIEQAGKGQEVVVVTFEPLPQADFAPMKAPTRLSSSRQKLELLEQSGVDLVWTMRFNQELAQMSASIFAESVLSKALAASMVVVGEDFRFGRSREGDLAMLRKLGAPLGFAVQTVADIEVDGERVSSTAVRAALKEGDIEAAEKFIGRRFMMQGEVIEGSKLGRELGYPTANMRLEAEPSPLSGVFAVRVRVASQGTWLNGVASLGKRPAVGGKEFLVEVHIFDFSADLYGRRLEVDFVAKIRDEENFESMSDLVAQIKKDECRAKEILQGSLSNRKA
jgi:riboflavin kinase/FMN adenylyltransferase